EAPAGDGAIRRVIRIDGRPAASQAELGRRLALVWLTPAMDRLLVEGPGNRRRFLDRLVFGFYLDHAAQLAAYEQAMRERNRLLRGERWDAAWLAALEETMAGTGVAVAAGRRELVARLRAAAGTQPGGDAFPTAELSISGLLEDW